VVAFEPQEDIYNLLTKNFKGETHNCALSFESGTTVMPRVRYGDKGNYGGMSCNSRSELGHIKVPMFTLDGFSFERVAFIKLDVEGFELNVLKGGEATIKRDHPIMYIEDDRAENTKALRAYITSLGYTIEEDNPPLYCEDNFFGLKKNIWDKNYVSKNIICRYAGN
jgi:FkbM family methyltransferase